MTEIFRTEPIEPPRGFGERKETPAFPEVLKSSLELQSGFFGLYRAATQKTFQRDPAFQLDEWFREKPTLLKFQSSFDGVESEAEARDVESRIAREEEMRAIREAAGFSGVMLDIGAAIMSPSSYVPFGGVVGGLRGVAKIGGIATTSVALDESILQATQETRTAEETQTNLIATAIVGTALGGLAALMTPEELNGAVANFGRQESKRFIGPGQPESLSSAKTETPLTPALEFGEGDQLVGVLSKGDFAEASIGAKLMDKTMRAGAKGGAVMRNLVNRNPVVRGFQAQLSDAALYFNRDTPTAVAGTIETKTKLRMNSVLSEGLKGVEDAYAKYWHGKKDVGWLRRNMAEIGGTFPIAGKMSRPQFDKLAFVHAQQPMADVIPEVEEAAKVMVDKFYRPLFKEMKAVGMLEGIEEGDVVGAINYINHVMNRDQVVRNPAAFEDMVARSYDQQMKELYAQKLERVTTANTQAERDIEDISRPEAEVSQIQEDIRAERGAIAETPAADVRVEIRAIRRELRDLDKLGDVEGPGTNRATPVFPVKGYKKKLRERLKGLEESLTDEQKATLVRDNALRRRSQLLSRSVGRLETRQQAALEKLEDLDTDAISALRGIGKRLGKFIDELDELSDEAFDKGVGELEEGLKKLGADLKRLDERATKLEKSQPDLSTDEAMFNEPSSRIALGRLRASRKVDELTETLDGLRAQGPEGTRAILKEWQDDILIEVSDRIEKIGARRAKLSDRFIKLDPETVNTRIKEMQVKASERTSNLNDWVRLRGGTEEEGILDFTEGGRDYGKQVRKSIEGDPTIIPGLAMAVERGPELARVLDIPIAEKMEFLETDLDKLMRIYASTVVPDIEMNRAGWGANGAKALEKVQEAYEKEKDALRTLTVEDVPERNKLLEASGVPALRQGKMPRQKPGEAPEAFKARQDQALAEFKGKEAERIEAERRDVIRLFEGQIERLRRQRAVPQNPDAWLYRGGKMAMNWNVMTMMGNVLMPSLVDPASVVWRYGARNIWRHSLRHMIGNFKNLRMVQREALYSGMNDTQLQDRWYQMNDLMEDAGRRTKVEKGAEFLANKIGLAGLFSYWTQYMKQWATPMVVGKMMDALEVHQSGKKMYGMTPAKARQTLAHFQINGELADRIWAQQADGGLIKHRGLWVPNTQSWTDDGARDAFRASILSEVEAMIVTPGLERPLFTDQTLGHKMLFQFQSFMWSSHSKVLMAGLQKRDVDVMEGVLAGVALGAMSFYADKIARGEREEADNMSLAEWSDEILIRSPFLGAVALPLKLGQATPTGRQYLQFSDRGAERRFADEPLGVLAGPTFTTLRRASKLATEANDPTQSTVNTFKQLVPFNNLFYMRQLFQKVVENSGFPEERGD